MQNKKYLPIFPRIGAKFTGQPALFYDQQNGMYWESLPVFDADTIKIQRGLLKKTKATKTNDSLPKLKRRLSDSIVGRLARSFWKWC